MSISVRRWMGASWQPSGTQPGSTMHDWSDSNLPWAYPSDEAAAEALFTAEWPSDVTYVDLPTASNDFYANLYNVCNNASGRVVVRLPAGTYHLNQFRMIGSSGDPTYAFGFWHPRLRGFLGKGPDKTIIQMDANSMTNDQLDRMKTMTASSFAPLQMGLMRIDGQSGTSTILIAGVTFQSADQQNLTQVAADLVAKNIYVPQPAPHNGVVLYQNANAIVSYTRFRAAGRAMYSAPPFECANVGSQYGDILFNNCEMDGRRAPELDGARPRRCAPIMGNNEDAHELRDCWVHHSNLSRYAVNDENQNTSGPYTVIRCKFNNITDTRNIDPALNNGTSLGGWSDPCSLGWESVSGTITIEDCIISQDNPQFQWQNSPAMHYGLTSVGSRNPQGGRMYVRGGEHRNTAWPWLDGYATFRIQPSAYWATDGWNTTLFVYNKQGARLTPYHYTGTWPVSAATLTAGGISPNTHFIIRSQ